MTLKKEIKMGITIAARGGWTAEDEANHRMIAASNGAVGVSHVGC